MTAILLDRPEAVKLSENALLLILRNANPGIPDFDTQEIRAATAADDNPTLERVAQSVGHQIEEDPFEQDKVAADPGRVGYDPQAQPSLSRHCRKRHPDPLQQLSDREFRNGWCKNASVELGNIQQRIEQLVHRPGGNIDLLDEAGLFGWIILVVQLRDEQVQGMERLSEVMACRRKKARLGEVRRLQVLIELPELRRRSVDVGSQSAQLVAVDDFNALREIACSDLIEPGSDLGDRANQRP